ncbi:MAG: lipase family protein [Nostoc desertorum CM1-VF14]|jgi:alpha-beta hydrolase superfamily lysophospholipase|nr:lipase family protein [Nostoc desertorum CM1-VF14]
MKKALLCCFGIILAMWVVVSPALALSPDKPGLLPTFYDVPKNDLLGSPGSLIKSERVDAPDGASAWRVVYRSRKASGVPVAVSGLVVVPITPKDNLPVISWAHGTVGGARYCAPSNVPNPVTDFVGYPSLESTAPNDYGIPGLSTFIKAGYVVVASDYQGLGTGENHEYAVGLSQAQNALDIVTAAQKLTPAVGNKVALLGWSQGGLAVVTAGENASYTPDLHIVGIATLAPANPKSFLIPDIAKQSTGGPRIGRIILLERAYTWAYEDLQLSDVFTDIGIKAAEAASGQCMQQLSITGDTAGGDTVLFKQNTNPDAWKKKFIKNAIGQKGSDIPVLVMQGTADNIIPPDSTDLYVRDACEHNTPIFYKKYIGKDHRSLLLAAEVDFTTWISDRFTDQLAKKSVLSNCPVAEIKLELGELGTKGDD